MKENNIFYTILNNFKILNPSYFSSNKYGNIFNSVNINRDGHIDLLCCSYVAIS